MIRLKHDKEIDVLEQQLNVNSKVNIYFNGWSRKKKLYIVFL